MNTGKFNYFIKFTDMEVYLQFSTEYTFLNKDSHIEIHIAKHAPHNLQ